MLIIIGIAVVALALVMLLGAMPAPRDCIRQSRGGGAAILNNTYPFIDYINIEPEFWNTTINVTLNVTSNYSVQVEIWSDNGLVYNGTGKAIKVNKQVANATVVTIIVKPVDPTRPVKGIVEYWLDMSTC